MGEGRLLGVEGVGAEALIAEAHGATFFAWVEGFGLGPMRKSFIPRPL